MQDKNIMERLQEFSYQILGIGGVNYLPKKVIIEVNKEQQDNISKQIAEAIEPISLGFISEPLFDKSLMKDARYTIVLLAGGTEFEFKLAENE